MLCWERGKITQNKENLTPTAHNGRWSYWLGYIPRTSSGARTSRDMEEKGGMGGCTCVGQEEICTFHSILL